MSKNTLLFTITLFLCAACGDDPTDPDIMLNVTFTNLETLSEGTYEGWVIDQAGVPHSTGTFTLAADGQHAFTSPIDDPQMFVLTVEPPGDTDPAPSDQKLLGGAIADGAATLTSLGFVSADLMADFSTSPGTHVLLTPTTATDDDNDAGIWLLGPPAPGDAPSATVTLPVLNPGWVYEGWVVYAPGTANQMAFSYGKYTPGTDGVLSGRDSDAAGPFSGAPGDLSAGPPFPGSDFVALNGSPAPMPTIPFDFNGDDAVTGDSMWMHVISIEPAFDEGEGSLAAVPFQLKPYGDAFGDGGPTDARTITALNPLPTGSVVVVQ